MDNGAGMVMTVFQIILSSCIMTHRKKVHMQLSDQILKRIHNNNLFIPHLFKGQKSVLQPGWPRTAKFLVGMLPKRNVNYSDIFINHKDLFRKKPVNSEVNLLL